MSQHAVFNPPIECRQSGSDWKVLLTHIEIRRVQNGFVIMGLNASTNPSFDAPLDRMCFVASTEEELVNTIRSLCSDTGNFVWSASVDIPIIDLTRKVPI
jgi:hypothetical protein